ncbi:MAG: c-type cytochrome [Anaerolineae bacterium]|uniref:c-type cytochrome n=1 Tax=Candidatus Flexifilum breve TaxID=3140694 RepID=UPI001AD34B05|nr:c-type cytochrome [Chloroflexota bacterium]MBN8637046.1 c-type cytochrome [Anaerolineae bacterium]
MRGRRMTGMLVSMALLLAACGGGTDANTTDNTSAPAASSTPVVNVPTFSFTQPTAPPAVATAAATLVPAGDATAEASALDPEKVERGRGRYEALECASCHGANGEGVTDQGGPLLEYAATEADFVTFMRSGGELGVDHQYATNRLSDSGASNLYAYLQSLQGE